MGKKISRFKVGLFILICTGIGVGALIWIGVGHFWQPTKTYVTFFDQTIEGLHPGANVDYRGVQVGRVSTIGLALDGKLIRVVMQLNPLFKITDSMAVELKPKGFAGGDYLAITKAPPNIKDLTPAVTFPVKYPIIPSRGGELAEVEQALENVYQKFQSTDFEGLVEGWKKTAENVNAILTDPSVKETLHNVKEVSSDLKGVSGGLGKPWTPEEWKEGFKNLFEAFAAARKTSETLEAQLQGVPPDTLAHLAERLDRTVGESQKALGNWGKEVDQSLALFQDSLFQVNQILSELRGLVHDLREQPGQILTRPEKSEPFRR
jgi:ABC-type transporter Mla subunit MlaD